MFTANSLSSPRIPWVFTRFTGFYGTFQNSRKRSRIIVAKLFAGVSVRSNGIQTSSFISSSPKCQQTGSVGRSECSIEWSELFLYRYMRLFTITSDFSFLEVVGRWHLLEWLMAEWSSERVGKREAERGRDECKLVLSERGEHTENSVQTNKILTPAQSRYFHLQLK